MNKQVFGFLTAAPLVAAGVVFSPVAAQAAEIGMPTTRLGDFFDIYGISSIGGANNGVIVRVDQAAGTATFDFVPPVGGGTGEYEVDFVNGAFDEAGESFAGTTGTVKDITIPFITSGSVPVNVPEFLALGDGNFFDLDEVFAPTFTSIGTGTVVSFGVGGTFRSSSGETYMGEGAFSTTFVGLSQAQIINLASTPGGLRTPYSATFEAVPEPMTMLGVGTALGLGALFKRKQAKKENKA